MIGGKKVFSYFLAGKENNEDGYIPMQIDKKKQ